jgi:hypothetical protein
MDSAGLDVVIWGVTRAGRTFRPSDWSDRLAGLTSAFGDDHKLSYSPFVRPISVGGVKAVIVAHQLETLEPRLFRFFVGFAQDNELRVERVAEALAKPQRLSPPATAGPGARDPLPPREPV